MRGFFSHGSDVYVVCVLPKTTADSLVGMGHFVTMAFAEGETIEFYCGKLIYETILDGLNE